VPPAAAWELLTAPGRRALWQSRETGDPTEKTNDLVGWDVDDVEATVLALKAKGVVFEEYDYSSLKTVEGIARIGAMQAAWFKDPDGNLLALVSG
jgi:catechol 2,3-dioxygenase-like lactoylglutathione lyase family enzyme